MSHTTLVLALITVGLVVAATSAAFNLNPMQWLSQSPPDGASQPSKLEKKTAPAPTQP
jgi:hypothetical protein